MRRALTNDRSCWGNRNQFMYWMLDPAENSMRMRKKLKRNYKGTDHKEASLTWRRQQSVKAGSAQQDTSLSITAEEQPQEKQPESQPQQEKPKDGSSVAENQSMEPAKVKSNEDILKSLSGIHITVRRNSMGIKCNYSNQFYHCKI